MRRNLRAVACLLWALAAAVSPSGAQTAAGGLYTEAMAREKALRAAVSAGAPPTTARDYRAAAAAYEAIVRKHHGSGYADNALWQAGVLLLDAFERFGDNRDRLNGTHLLGRLVSEYPGSRLAGPAAERLTRVKEALATPKRAAPPAPAHPEPAPAPEPPPPPPAPLPADAAVKPPPPEKPPALLRDIHRTLLPEAVRITIELDAEVVYRTERIENPPRVLFDLAGTILGVALREGARTYTDDVVKVVRIGRHPGNVTRIVLDLAGVRNYSVFTLYNPFRVVVDCVRDATPAPPVPPGAAVPHPAPGTPQHQPPAASPTPPPSVPAPVKGAPRAARPAGPTAPPPAVASSEPLGDPTWPRRPLVWLSPPPPADSVPPQPKDPLPAPAVPSERPAVPAAGPSGYSLSRQLGLGASRIVLDPGHGGHDPGAGGSGVTESTVVLDVSLRLEKLLRASGVDVVMTRRSDEFVPLEQRTEIANRAQGDLFLSIHANASRNRAARGIESYYLNFATNPDAEAVAARENASTDRTMSNLTDLVKAIALNNKLDESRTLAGLVQRELAVKLRPAARDLQNHGVKQAPFVVLVGASMPSVLVEVSFITNREEGRLLKSPAYRQRIAEALFSGIRAYQRSLKGTSVTTIQ